MKITGTLDKNLRQMEAESQAHNSKITGTLEENLRQMVGTSKPKTHYRNTKAKNSRGKSEAH